MKIALKQVKPVYMSEAEIAVSDIYLQETVVFEQGKYYLVRAGSGRGKSSFLNFIYGSSEAFEGTIQFEGHEHSPAFQLREKKLSYVFQAFKLFGELSAFDNIELKNVLTAHKSATEIKDLLAKVGLADKSDRLVKHLSLGQKQRVAILRSLCQPFDFLLLDEPFSHLDDQNISILTELIKKEVAANNAGIILTSLGSEYLFDYNTILAL